MNSTQIAKMIDHTILKATTTKEDVVKICKEAKEYGFFSVCINPANIELAKEELKGSNVKVCTVIGFPLGANTSAVVDAANKEALVKVIIETCYLTDEEKKIACELAVKAGTDYVKTSTGFGTGGSTPADIKLMRETVGENIGVKASGGVRCEEDAVKVIDAGATRIGASASIAIVSGNNESKSDY